MCEYEIRLTTVPLLEMLRKDPLLLGGVEGPGDADESKLVVDLVLP